MAIRSFQNLAVTAVALLATSGMAIANARSFVPPPPIEPDSMMVSFVPPPPIEPDSMTLNFVPPPPIED